MLLLHRAVAARPANALGQHPESADLPTPRLNTSKPKLKNPRSWRAFHDRLVAEAALACDTPPLPGLLMVGDSLTERWRGTELDHELDGAQRYRHALATTLGGKWPKPLIYAIAGDQTQHLLWRLRDLPAALLADARLLVVVQVGTNNFGSGGHTEEQVASGILAIARHLLDRSRGRQAPPAYRQSK